MHHARASAPAVEERPSTGSAPARARRLSSRRTAVDARGDVVDHNDCEGEGKGKLDEGLRHRGEQATAGGRVAQVVSEVERETIYHHETHSRLHTQES